MSELNDPGVILAVRAYVKLLRASRSVVARLEPLLARHGLTPTQLGVLETILHKGPQSHRELGRKVLTSAGNMTDVIDKLETRALVSRVRDRVDRRQVYVDLTEQGRTLITGLFPIHAADIGRAMSGLEATELREFDRLLRKLGHDADADLDEPALATRDSSSEVSVDSFDNERSAPETSP